MSFPRYPKYKPSGVEWLGDVPAHWEVKRLRQIGRLLKGGGGTKEDVVDAGVPCVRYGDLYTTFSYHISKPRGFVTPERVPDYTPLQFGDVLFAASGEKLAEIGKSAVNLLPTSAVCGGDVVILRPEVEVDSRYLGYACDSPTAAMQKASLGRGTTVKHIYPDELRLILLAFPPIPEQRAIATFLDHETATIDGLVAEQQRLIELLKEKRQAVISHAVTKGLDPKAPMKPSGVEWLGDVPAHWEVKRLRQIGRLLKGGGGTKEDVVDAGVPCVRYGDLYTTFSYHISKPRGFVTPERVPDYTPLQFGDVLFAASGEKLAEIGKSAVNLLPTSAVCGGDVVILRPEVEVDSRYLGYACDSPTAAMQKASLGRGTTVKHIYPDELRLILLAFPPIPEQRAIATFLDHETATIDGLVAEAESAITLLQERRSALISAAVTGQIDVRNTVTSEAA